MLWILIQGTSDGVIYNASRASTGLEQTKKKEGITSGN